MSKKVKFHLDKFLNLKNFKKINWGLCLHDYQHTHSISYIDFQCIQLSSDTLKTLASFLDPAAHLNITCTFWLTQIDDQTLNNTLALLPEFHRIGIVVDQYKSLQDLLNHPAYQAAKNRFIFHCDVQTFEQHFSEIEKNIAFVHIPTQINTIQTASLGIHSTLPAQPAQIICNDVYQENWPYESNTIFNSSWSKFEKHCQKSKYIYIRTVISAQERRLRNRLKQFFKHVFLNSEHIVRCLLLNRWGLKVHTIFLNRLLNSQSLPYPKATDENKILEQLVDTANLQRISSSEYRIEESFFDKMNGAIEWQGIYPKIKTSSTLLKINTPCLISAQFSGVAQLIGFCVGEKQFIMVQPTQQTHDLCLSIQTNGRYKILLDDHCVEPVFSPDFYTPSRINQLLDLRLAVRNIFVTLITQQIRHSSGLKSINTSSQIDYSIVVVCTRFSRRLEQLLKSICTQQYPHKKLQVLVGYVPGIDGTDDTIDNLKLTYPDLNIDRVPFHISKQHHKGHMVNHTLKNALGKKILLTDADIIFPPDLFSILDQKYANHGFVGAYARKMLTPKTTANILLGNVNVKDNYAALLENDPGELRIDEAKGRPIGFFQLVNAEYIRNNPYQDLPNFEGADAFFAEDIAKNCERPTLAKEITLLHMDHGGSQWYGAKRHL